MDRAEAIERFEKQLTAAQVVLDSGFGTKPGDNNCLYVVRKEMAAIALEALREQELARNSHDVAQACKWISVSERLPQEYGAVCKNVILLMDDGFVTVGWLNQVTGKGYYLDAVNDDVIREPLSRFTHWMALPEPPKEGGRGK